MQSVATLCASLLVVLTLATAGQVVQARRRISHTKCEEYRNIVKQTQTAIPLILDPPTVDFDTFNCSRTVDLIVGGEDAAEGEFPHQALIGWPPTEQPSVVEYDFRCGGTLISDRHILTAAHCTLLDDQAPVVVRLAELVLNDPYGDAVDFGIANITRHPNYTFRSSYHDIALIRLKTAVRLSEYIRPACLWDSAVQNFTTVIATGFGHTQFAVGEMSRTLRKVQLDTLDRDRCAEWYETDRKFRHGLMDHQLCFGSNSGGKDTCQGDSGGPIQVIPYPEDCTFYVVGVTSLGAACGLGSSQAIYTSVAGHIDWIENVVWGV